MLELIREQLGDSQSVFVFPTEVAARFWLRKSFELTPRRALPANRFLSWDQFKDSELVYPNGVRAVNRAARTLFACSFLEANRARPFLRQLVHPKYAGEPLAFVRALRVVLPFLHHLPGLQAGWPESSAAKREDLLLLYREYRAFLKESGLFEPAYEQPVLKTGKRHFFLFYPESLDEFSSLEKLISGHPQLTLVHLPPPGQPDAPEAGSSILAFEDSIQEIRWVLCSIAALLDRGTDPGNIVISAADLPSLESYLERQAGLYEVPLSIHRGRGLTSFPPCRLFARIQACVDSRFSLPALRDFLLDRALPWREEALCRAMIRLGQDCRIMKNPAGNGPDLWERGFLRTRSFGNPQGFPLGRLQAFYRKLKTSLLEITRAEDFRRIKDLLVSFSKAFLDSSAWQEQELKVFQFALDTLADLEEARRYLPTRPSAPYRLWLSYVEESLYVPGKTHGGVSVYGYRVAESILPEHHFVINASQSATRHIVRTLPFLNAHEEESLGLEEHDLSPLHLQLYSLSGQRVWFSYSRRGFSQNYLPPGYFVVQGSVLSFAASGAPAPADPYAAEAEAWANQSAFPLLPAQQRGFRQAMSTSLAAKGLDATRRPLDGEDLAEAVRGRLRTQDGHLKITATGLESFLRCPFGFLLEEALDLAVEELRPAVLEAREFGQIMHRAFQLFYRTVQRQEPSGQLSPDQAQRYRLWLRSIVGRTCSAYASRHPVPIRPVWRQFRRQALDLARSFLEVELKEMSAETIVGTERLLQALMPVDGVLLSGKIDRISQSPGGVTLVDYKKKKVPSRREIFGEDPSSFQMPFYLTLLRENGMPVHRAAYYSIEEGRYSYVVGGAAKNKVDPQTLDRSFTGLKQRIRSMAGRIMAGDFRFDDPYQVDCRGCSLGEICRRRYTLR